MVFKKHGGRKTVISPDGETWEGPPPLVDNAMIRALARAFRWQRQLDAGAYGTFDELAKAERVSQSHVSRMLRLTLLSPDLIEAIRGGGSRKGCDWRASWRAFPMSGAVSGNAWRCPCLPKACRSFLWAFATRWLRRGRPRPAIRRGGALAAHHHTTGHSALPPAGSLGCIGADTHGSATGGGGW